MLIRIYGIMCTVGKKIMWIYCRNVSLYNLSNHFLPVKVLDFGAALEGNNPFLICG